MKKLFVVLFIFALCTPAFGGVCQSYADLPNPAFALAFTQNPNHSYTVQGIAMRAEPGKNAIPSTFAYEATPFNESNGITEYRWQDGADQTPGLLKIKRENAQIVLSIIWLNIHDPSSIYELQCSDDTP